MRREEIGPGRVRYTVARPPWRGIAWEVGLRLALAVLAAFVIAVIASTEGWI